jgi:tRNA 2-selenouridine synthase
LREITSNFAGFANLTLYLLLTLMPITKLSITDFLAMAKHSPVLDVRSPGEFLHAYIPGAYSLPLFSDEERKIVGTAYKQESREKAIKIGLDYFGKKMVRIVEEVEALTAQRKAANPENGNTGVLIHCWRGGMRSAGIAWLLDLYGFTVYTLTGGYKAYRNWVLKQFLKEYNFHVLGGYTGSGKTNLLQQLADHGESVIDLEKLAGHKGSAFGNLLRLPQPSQEMFENELAMALSNASSQPSATIWVEDESQRIGLVNIPAPLLKTIRQQQLFFIDVPFEERLDHIVQEYGDSNKEALEAAILRIRKRLGGLDTKNAIGYLHENQIKDCFRILLAYYDKSYRKTLPSPGDLQKPIIKIEAQTTDAAKNIRSFLLHQKT